VSLRSLGRWLYHTITSSDKRPYIETSLEELEDLADESSSASEAFRMLGIFDELTYRITSPERRDLLKTRIANQLLRMEGIRLPISSDRDKVSEIRAQLLSKYAEKTDAERAAKEEAAAEKARLEAEAKAQQKEAERWEAARKAKEEAAAEKARLEAETNAQREDEIKAQREAEWRNGLGTKPKDLETRRKAIEEQRRIAEESRKKILLSRFRSFLRLVHSHQKITLKQKKKIKTPRLMARRPD
jgi:hypothetical protein